MTSVVLLDRDSCRSTVGVNTWSVGCIYVGSESISAKEARPYMDIPRLARLRLPPFARPYALAVVRHRVDGKPFLTLDSSVLVLLHAEYEYE
jgi:hypothetical protein